MTRVHELFTIHRGRGAYLSDLSLGLTPLISSTTDNNGVLALVDLEPTFQAPAITVGRVSGKAFVQTDAFATVPDDMAVLEPREVMPLKHLYLVAALINRAHWRFSYYRKLTPTRLGLLHIPFEEVAAQNDLLVSEPRSLLPPRRVQEEIPPAFLDVRYISLTDLFDIIPGDIHNASEYGPGDIPLISCSDWGNGILGYFDLKDVPLYRNALTVAYNGSPLAAKYHHYTFATKDDIAVLLPKTGVTLETVFWVMAWLNLQRWRYSYYRKCYQGKLVRLEVPLLMNHDGSVQEETIRIFLESSSPYWDYVKSVWTTSEKQAIAVKPPTLLCN